MPDPNLNAAIQEAYATAPEIVVYHCLEFQHPLFAQSIRVVQGFEDITAQGVLWQAMPFDLKPPDIHDQGPPMMTITLDNVSGAVVRAIESIIDSEEPVIVTYRAFLETDLTQPANGAGISLALTAIVATASQVTGTCTLAPMSNMRWPTKIYTDDEYPGLIVG